MNIPSLKHARQRAFAWLLAICFIIAVIIIAYIVTQVVHAVEKLILTKYGQIVPNAGGDVDPRMDGLRKLTATLQNASFPVITDANSNIVFRAVVFAADSPIGSWTNAIVDQTYFGPVDGLAGFLTTNFAFTNLMFHDAAAMTNAPQRFYNLTEVR